MHYVDSGNTKVKNEITANGHGHFKLHEVSSILDN